MIKKILTTITMFLVIFGLTGCNVSEKNIPTPENITLEQAILKWEKVKKAKSYLVLVDESTYETKNNHFDLNELDLSYGTYEVKVASKNRKNISTYSEAIIYILEDPLENIFRAPKNLEIEGSILSWDNVKVATSYKIELDNEFYEVVTNSFDLAPLNLLPNTYSIKVYSLIDSEISSASETYTYVFSGDLILNQQLLITEFVSMINELYVPDLSLEHFETEAEYNDYILSYQMVEEFVEVMIENEQSKQVALYLFEVFYEFYSYEEFSFVSFKNLMNKLNIVPLNKNLFAELIYGLNNKYLNIILSMIDNNETNYYKLVSLNESLEQYEVQFKQSLEDIYYFINNIYLDANSLMFQQLDTLIANDGSLQLEEINILKDEIVYVLNTHLPSKTEFKNFFYVFTLIGNDLSNYNFINLQTFSDEIAIQIETLMRLNIEIIDYFDVYKLNDLFELLDKMADVEIREGYLPSDEYDCLLFFHLNPEAEECPKFTLKEYEKTVFKFGETLDFIIAFNKEINNFLIEKEISFEITLKDDLVEITNILLEDFLFVYISNLEVENLQLNTLKTILENSSQQLINTITSVYALIVDLSLQLNEDDEQMFERLKNLIDFINDYQGSEEQFEEIMLNIDLLLPLYNNYHNIIANHFELENLTILLNLVKFPLALANDANKIIDSKQFNNQFEHLKPYLANSMHEIIKLYNRMIDVSLNSNVYDSIFENDEYSNIEQAKYSTFFLFLDEVFDSETEANAYHILDSLNILFEENESFKILFQEIIGNISIAQKIDNSYITLEQFLIDVREISQWDFANLTNSQEATIENFFENYSFLQ